MSWQTTINSTHAGSRSGSAPPDGWKLYKQLAWLGCMHIEQAKLASHAIQARLLALAAGSEPSPPSTKPPSSPACSLNLDSERLRISRVVRRVLRGSDWEDVTSELLLRTHMLGRPLLYCEIKHATIDHLRHLRVIRRAEETRARLGTPPSGKASPLQADLVSTLIMRSSLSIRDKQIIIDHFYLGLSLPEIARERHLPLSALRARFSWILLQLRLAAMLLSQGENES